MSVTSPPIVLKFYPVLHKYIETLLPEVERIPPERQEILHRLSEYIAEKSREGELIQLNFICTHNSRRSHISQIWATAAASYHGIKNIKCYSGGTEATAFNPRAVQAMERAGFWIDNPGGTNPRYLVTFSEEGPYVECFSKVYDDPYNPREDFAAVMTCSHADENCPFIPGAKRIPVTYEDPKVADDTPEESQKYDERVRQIGAEMMYAMRVSKELAAMVS